MASNGTPPAGGSQAKLSFAKVVASSYQPQNTKESSSSPKAVETQSQPTIQLPGSPRPASGDGMPRAQPGADNSSDADARPETEGRTGQWATAASAGNRASPQPESKEDEAEKLRPAMTLPRSLAHEDSATQLSSSDGSPKPPSLDGKSVASANTFVMDEKESIRPDDSASLRAVEEEDVTSPPDSVTAGSRVGSDSGVGRAFRDQLHEIAVMGTQSQRGPPGRFPNPNALSHTLYDPNHPANGIGRPMSQPVANGISSLGGPDALPANPDEKLIEALESPRDRLFVLKLEQDFIDFIKDSCESEFILPNCNTFYRMLAHRLADYYLLGHVVDDTMTGVRITRTSYCRIPAPLSKWPVSSKNTGTPPADFPARKIMRRGEDGRSGTNTAANSEGPSKTTSEASGGSGSDGGNEGNEGETKEKSALTREEREARYREARQRIFGSAEPTEGDSTDAVASGEDKDMSRSSSTSGKKKTKKQRNYDDDFEARSSSRFSPFHSQQYSMSGFGGEQPAYYGYPVQMPNQQFPGMAAPSNYGGAYSMMVPQDPQSQFAWANQQYAAANNGMGYPVYNPAQNGYDLQGDFQRMGLQSSALQSQVTPKMANAPVAQEPYQAQNMPMNGWSPMAQRTYAGVQAPFTPNGPGNRPMSAPMQGPQPGQYPYGQLPASPYNGVPARNQHPVPGSFNRQQFNPQTQAFVPGGRNAPFQMQGNMSPMASQGMNGYNHGYAMGGSTQSPGQVMNSSPTIAQGQPPAFGSPQGMRMQSPSDMKSNGPGPNALQMSPGGPQNSSSIAKWGTPSHLPPRPPAPQQGNNKFTLHSNGAFPALPSSLPPRGPGGNGNGNGMMAPNYNGAGPDMASNNNGSS